MAQLSQESSKVSVITDPMLTADDVSIASLPVNSNDASTHIPRDVETLRKLAWYEWFHKEMIAFLLLGVLVKSFTCLPLSALTETSSHSVSGISYAIPAATASFVTPLFAHHIPYPVRMYLNLAASLLALLFCTLGSTVAGPVVGAALAGTVYAFGSNTYLATAAFYDQRTVITLSIGMNLSCLVGTALYVLLMQAALNLEVPEDQEGF
ncbi:hypothetical protein EWM64_g5751 [Hericium alpestre]|uniref:Uncharacterized protein n=1 Tax=Hericium alpestre TaxID=135208 RepID=A0A4Y9ZXM7_9AGAM|nr:hypothetical protein EWM64_g5751 [Hericium alpestre]